MAAVPPVVTAAEVAMILNIGLAVTSSGGNGRGGMHCVP